MFLGIQLLGLMFVVVMIYFTYLNYKRHNYGSRSFVSWLVVWLGAAVIILIPYRLYSFMEFLNIERTSDFFFAGAIVVLFVAVFIVYVDIKKTKAKMEELVRNEALRNPIRRKK